jgi:hypothetical protein
MAKMSLTSVSSFLLLLISSSASFAVEELNLDLLKKTYPACRQFKNNCFGESNYDGPDKQKQIGIFKGNRLFTGNVYEFDKFSGSCRELICEMLPDCSYSILKLKYTCRNGDSYYGFTYDNKGNKKGQGVYEWSNGDKYEGVMKDGLYDGKGVLFYSNSDLYRGEYKRDLKHGRGYYKWSNGDSYEGTFFEGMRTGEGTLLFADGDKYVGEFKDNKFHGMGVFYYTNGTKKIGRWIDHNYVGR